MDLISGYMTSLCFSTHLSVDMVRSAMLKAGVSKICHLHRGLSWISVEELAQKMGFRSERSIKKLLYDLEEAFPAPV